MQRQGQLVKFLGVLWSGETKGMPETVFDKKNTGVSISCNVRVTSLYRAEGVPVAFFLSIPTCPDIKTLYALVKKRQSETGISHKSLLKRPNGLSNMSKDRAC